MDQTTKETIRKVKELWQKGEPFFLQGSVHSPYSGCWEEPNIWLVTPLGCPTQKDLMHRLPTIRHPKVQRLHDAHLEAVARLQKAENRLDRLMATGIYSDWSWIQRASLDKAHLVLEEYDCTTKEEEAAESLKSELDKAVATHGSQWEWPDLCIWPLYASGQGLAMDAIRTLDELIQVIQEESVYELAARPFNLMNGALEGTRMLIEEGWRLSQASGQIDSWTASELGPINEVLEAAPRFWMPALEHAAGEGSDALGLDGLLDLTWICEGCNEVIPYDPYEGRPHYTGTHGDGGIGLHYTGIICDSCLDNGTCRRCDVHGYSDDEKYSSDVAEHD